jgi:hypothetical protein
VSQIGSVNPDVMGQTLTFTMPRYGIPSCAMLSGALTPPRHYQFDSHRERIGVQAIQLEFSTIGTRFVPKGPLR